MPTKPRHPSNRRQGGKKWFLPVEREPDGALAREAIGRLAMRDHRARRPQVGNVLTIHSGWPAEKIAAALDLLIEICGDPIELLPADYRIAADLALAHNLTFYDASYAAIARRTGRCLLSANNDLMARGEPGRVSRTPIYPQSDGVLFLESFGPKEDSDAPQVLARVPGRSAMTSIGFSMTTTEFL